MLGKSTCGGKYPRCVVIMSHTNPIAFDVLRDLKVGITNFRPIVLLFYIHYRFSLYFSRSLLLDSPNDDL